MIQSDLDRFRTALEEIVRVATTPDTAAVGTLSNGEVGAIWSAGGKDRAFEEIVKIAKAALDGS